MNRETLIAAVRRMGIPLSQCWVGYGGALVVHGLRESAADIDVCCDSATLRRFCTKTACAPAGSIELLVEPALPEELEWAGGVQVHSLAAVLSRKRSLGRPKDAHDIERIAAELRRRDERAASTLVGDNPQSLR